MSRPQVPEILVGFRDRFWVLAILMDTGWNSSRKVAQQKGLPQMPSPPSSLASSRTPICRSSMRVWNTPAKSFTRARKSTLPSEVKKKRILFPSKLYSTSTSFISRPCWAIFSRQMPKARCSFSLFRRTVSRSRSVARRTMGRRGWTTVSSSTMVLPWTHSPYSRPREVSMITPCPGSTGVPWGSK